MIMRKMMMTVMMNGRVHTSMQLTLKSEEGVSEGLPKVAHSCDLPLFKSSSNQSPNLPVLAPITRLVAQPLMNSWLAVVHVYTWQCNLSDKRELGWRVIIPRGLPIGMRTANILRYLEGSSLHDTLTHKLGHF